jgi:DNA repair protein RecN (Recombination protein N)
MLKALRIRDYALIDSLTIEFAPGLNVLTGETGAGKSIILGALSLILGEKADTDMIRTGSEAAIVEAEFTSDRPGIKRLLEDLALDPPDGNDLVVRRKVARTGKGACLLNDHSVSLPLLKQLGDILIDLHGQHEHQSLLNPDLHLLVLDEFAGLNADRDELGEKYQVFQTRAAELNRLRQELKLRRERQDLTAFQVQELQAARLAPDEFARLFRERELLDTAERRRVLVAELSGILTEQEGSVQEQLSAAAKRLEALVRLDPDLARTGADLNQAVAVLDDVNRAVARYQEAFEHSPGRLDEINERLFLIERLVRKYAPPATQPDAAGVEFLLAEQARLSRELASLETDETRLPELEKAQAVALAELTKLAHQLSLARARARTKFEQGLTKQMPELGLGSARLLVQSEPVEDPAGLYVASGKCYRLDATGIDRIEFLFAANPGEAPRPLRKVASGGELSRVMLALKSMLADRNQVPVMVFDEIDTGIGGRMAEAVGRRLSRLARNQQVICITHLPQIARFASDHFQVSKTRRGSRTVTRIARLEPEARLQELARMLAGDRITETAINHARELLKS